MNRTKRILKMLGGEKFARLSDAEKDRAIDKCLRNPKDGTYRLDGRPWEADDDARPSDNTSKTERK